MKRIAYFSRGFGIGGAETFLLNTFENIDKNKFDITLILATEQNHKDCLEDQAISHGVRIIHTNSLSGIFGYLLYIQKIYSILKREKFDIIHSNTGSFDGIIMIISKLAGIKKRICHSHTTQPQSEFKGAFSKIKATAKKLYFKMMQSFMCQFSTDRLACSKKAGEYFYGNKDFDLIYNGIHSGKYNSLDRKEKSKKLQELIPESSEKNFTIVSVGRISFEKNIFFAIDVIYELKKLRNDFQYIWVGNGELMSQAKEKVTQLQLEDIFIFTGTRTDVPSILGCCDIFLMTSLFEGLPFALIEAQYSNIISFVSDIVTDEADLGRTIYLSLNSSATEWAKAINDSLGKPTPPLNKEKAEQFDIQFTIKQLKKIYNR